MDSRTGEVREYSAIAVEERKNFSEPFSKNEIVEVKGLKFRITRWREGRLFLKLVKTERSDAPHAEAQAKRGGASDNDGRG